MCWFYMGIAQIALDQPPSVKRANVEKKVAQTIMASPYTPGQMWKKVPQTILASLYIHPLLMGNAHMESTYFKKGLP